MATTNPLPLPRMYSSGPNCIPALVKKWGTGSNNFQGPVTKFLHTGAAKIYGSRFLPATLDNGATVKAIAVCSVETAGTTGQKIRLNLTYASQASTETADPAVAQTVSVSQDVSGWTAKTYRLVEFTLTGSNLAASDLFEYALERDPTHADDNFDNPVYLHELHLLCNY